MIILCNNNIFGFFCKYEKIPNPEVAVSEKSQLMCSIRQRCFPGSSGGKESAFSTEDPGSIAGSERSAGEGIGHLLQYSWASLVAQMVKNLPAMREMWV